MELLVNHYVGQYAFGSEELKWLKEKNEKNIKYNIYGFNSIYGIS